jgi:hypothetical protein
MRNHTTPPDAQHERRAQDMGRRRREHDDRTSALAEAQLDAEQDRRAVCLQRWPGILGAIKGLLTAYNDGAGGDLLTASEQPDGDEPAVTITSQGTARATITVTVDGDALQVRTNPGSHSAATLHGIARRVDCSRTDIGTAAYLLQDWMDPL